MSVESAPDVEPTPAVPPVADKPKQYPFKVMAVLATAFRMTRRNLPLVLILAAVMTIPNLLAQYTTPLVAMLCQSVASAIATAFVSYAVIMDMNGTRPSLRACIAYGISRFWAVLGVSIFSAFAIIAGAMLLVVPGIIVALMFFVIVPVTVIERVGLDAAMKRSRELTSGRKGDLFVLGMCLGVLAVPFAMVAVSLEPWALKIWLGVFTTLVATFMSVLSAVVYVVLRQLREGTQMPELALAIARVRT